MGGGAARRVAVAALAVAVLAGVASAAVYEVGDKAGWTVMGNPNYAAWASSKKFRVNDVVGASRSPLASCLCIWRVGARAPCQCSLARFCFPIASLQLCLHGPGQATWL